MLAFTIAVVAIIVIVFLCAKLKVKVEADQALRQEEAQIVERVRGFRSRLDEMEAEYVLLLDAGGEYEGRGWFWSYYDTQWTGLNAITDDTPGFELLLARDDMRLYRIAA